MFEQSTIDLSKFRNVNFNIYISISADESHIYRIFQGIIYEILFKYCMKHLSSINIHENQLKSFISLKIHSLSAEKTRIFMLPTFNKNEGKVSEITEIIWEIILELDYFGEKFLEMQKFIMFKDDLLIIWNIRWIFDFHSLILDLQ